MSKWNKDTVLAEAKKYKDRQDFSVNCKGAYHWLSVNKRLDILDSVHPKRGRSPVDLKVALADAVASAKKYKTRTEFHQKDRSSYILIQKTNNLSLLDSFLPIHRNWTVPKALEEAKKYKTRTEFKKGCNGAYAFLIKDNNIKRLGEVIPAKRIMWDEASVLKEAAKYKSRKEFQVKSRSAYKWLLRNKKLRMLDTIHKVSRSRGWNLDLVKEETKKYSKRSDSQSNSSGAYTWLRDRNKLTILDELFPKLITRPFIKRELYD